MSTDHVRVEVKSRAELRRWLSKHHKQNESIWLVTYKKAAGAKHIPYAAIVEEALAFGWVDSLPRALDDERTMLRLSPRKAGSAWSKPNRERVARLIAGGRMHASGLAKVEAAKADGSWRKLAAAESGKAPPALAIALKSNKQARAGWEGYSAPTRRRIIEWITTAKRDATRVDRVEKAIAAAAARRDPLAWRPKR